MAQLKPHEQGSHLVEATAREKMSSVRSQFQTLHGELSVRDHAMVLLAGSTGPRRPEMIALSWADVNVLTLELTRFHRRLVFHGG